MDYIGTTERVLTAMRQLLSFVTSRISNENEDTFVHKAYKFVQNAVSTLEQMEQQAKKQWNFMLDSILSTAWLVVQIMSSGAAFNAVKWVTQEVWGLFEGRIPEYMGCNFDVLQRLLATASEKLENIQSTCYWLMEQVRNPLFLKKLLCYERLTLPSSAVQNLILNKQSGAENSNGSGISPIGVV